jgi:nucleotide-binding universal stress UspA family protein
MRTLLVPVDGSENSRNAAHYAADLALAIDAEVHLLHVVQIIVTPSVVPMGYVTEEMEKAGTTLLELLSADLKQRTHEQVKITSVRETGIVELKIEEICNRIQPFAIVMGAPESTLVLRFDTSHVLKAMKRLSYPLLIIPPDASFRGAPRVLIACDREDIFSGLSPIVPFLKELHELLSSSFQIIHIVADGESFEETRREYEAWQKELETFQPGGIRQVRRSNVEEGINDYLEHYAADWLVVLPKRHSLLEFHKSRAKDIVLHCPVPVLSLHE